MSDFVKKSTEELLGTLREKREALRVFRFGGAGSRTRNVREGRNLRREIAQILTEVNARAASERQEKLALKPKNA
ncbi:50S ribosomal protein L29 [Candidatus Kaiserbacteria bacterium RIFCSPHIGHO2_12_FULL_53_13]|uniref:Large ribosomal subunit protein uL29 n=1 Tax=Candidatus Kaiserbacteria bacterium RIFCSPHIGHO2_12_FULL_53_13 TaxID=1798502 RepID=A0A1F6E6P2_9BACT|nr:MAG: 50S ribosomal protein L29 [Candidatus Kaiserbacteria bacterium RIFCSPHIGHO2_12_FULL_53_13]OGG74644.1 MAG: 50S ribosomal protein L29 [Candidatus Kaiserbacteria bacterium RIFCSPLOWO2_01_FULL_52_36]